MISEVSNTEIDENEFDLASQAEEKGSRSYLKHSSYQILLNELYSLPKEMKTTCYYN